MSLKKSLAWMGWAQGASIVMQFASSIVLARYLTPYETGIYGLALATVSLLSLVQSLGLQAMMVREEEVTQDVAATAFAVNATISILLALMIVSASYIGGAALHESGVQRVMLALAATPIFGIFSFLPLAMLERNGEFGNLAAIGTVSGLVSTLSTILFAVLGSSYMSIAWAQWIGLTVSLFLANYLGRQHISYRIGFSEWRRIANFGLQMLAVTGVTQLSQRMSELTLGRVLGLGALGLFNRAGGINTIVWNNIHMVIGRVLFVDFAQIHRAGDSLRTRYLQVVAAMTALLWPAFAGLAVVGRPFIYYVYGERWIGSYGALVCITLASIALVASTMTWEIFAATGNLKTQTRIEFIRAIASFLLFFCGCLISLEAAAASRIIDAFIAFIIYRPHLDKMTETSLKDMIPIYLKSFLLTLITIAPSLSLMALNQFKYDVGVLYLVLSVLAGGILWICGLIALRHPLIQEAGKLPVIGRYARRAP